MRNWLFAGAMLFAATSYGVKAELKLNGELTQGALIRYAHPELVSATLNDTPLLVKEGRLVFGFGRDAALKQTLSLTFASGETQSHTLTLTPREYKIDRIEGVAQKYVSPPESVLKRIRNDAALVKEARDVDSVRLDVFGDFYRPAKGRISGVYGSQRVFNGTPKRPHFGLDIANKTGTPIYAPAGGTVTLAHPDLYYSGGTVVIDHGFGVTTTYIHMSKLHVKTGDTIKTGEEIGHIGATGRVTGPHLDWRLNWGSVRLDPALIMNSQLAQEQAQ